MNNIKINIPELLAPGGDAEKVRIALAYGADAVYCAGKQYGLRAFAGNLNDDELEKQIASAHSLGKRIYVTLNIIPHNGEMSGIPAYAEWLGAHGADGCIVSDPGVFRMVKKAAPSLPIHVSTQANVVNSESAKFWQDMGATRIILAREVTLEEINEMHTDCPGLELECFIHGAMCISWSGRCHLSSYMTGRDANRGACAQPCRYHYALMEEKRPGEYFPIEEDGNGSYILNSRDLCMIEHLKEIAEAGVTACKIEGRMKSIGYVAAVTSAYRREFNRLAELGEEYTGALPESIEALSRVSHRPYMTGFYFGLPREDRTLDSDATIKDATFIGVVRGWDEEHGCAVVEQRNRFCVGDVLSVLEPLKGESSYTVEQMYNEDYEPITVAPHPQMTVLLPMKERPAVDTLLRR